MKIFKFGGTSVGSVQSIQILINIIEKESKFNSTEVSTNITKNITFSERKQDNQSVKHKSKENIVLEEVFKEKPIVVLSAISGITNLLSSMASQAASGKDYSYQLEELQAKHFDIIKKLIHIQLQNPVFTKLKLFFNELEDLLQGVNSLRELTPKTLDLILSYGERCSTYMVSKIAEQYFPEVLFVDATELIKTDSHFGQAHVKIDLTEPLIQRFYQANQEKLLFVTGFIASNEKGEITTLGRGGSDYTAAIFASALDASEIQIWTDVNGMMTADPRMVKKAFSLPELSYTEAMELSYFGAKVIYPPTMIPAFIKKIPLIIKNTFDTQFTGTIIRHDCSKSRLPIKGISSIRDISVINLEGSGMIGKTGFIGRLFSLLSREQIHIVLITQSSSEHSITFAVHPTDAIKAQELIKQEFELELQAQKLEMPIIENDLSIVAIVGENMKRTPGTSGKLFYTLGYNGINVRAIAQGSSEYNISVIISKHDLSKALNAIHDAFYTQFNKTLNIFCLGTGKIGKVLFKQIENQTHFLQESKSIHIKVIGISNSKKMLFDEAGLSLKNWETLLDSSTQVANLSQFVEQMKKMNLSNCIFIDNSASSAPTTFYQQIFQSNISIVTSNKIGNSSSYEQYKIFRDTAHLHGVRFYYETNVGAGLPIIRTLKDLIVSGDKIITIEAILSGTISFLFNHFGENASFCDLVKLAQEKGYSEPDPRDDLKGTDFMRKMLILARDAGYALEEKDLKIENILPQSCLDALTIEDFYVELKASEHHFTNLKNKAKAERKALRYIGKLEKGQVSVSLQMVDEKHPFYMLSGCDNIISFTTERYKEQPLVIKGPGGGPEVTAAGVFADLMNVGS